MRKNLEKKFLPRKNGLENEVIISVIVLYILIALVMMFVHYANLSTFQTQSSSPFARVAQQEAGLPTNPPPRVQLSLSDIHRILTLEGYHETRNLYRDGDMYHTIAIKDGQYLDLEVDAITGKVWASPVTH